VRLKYGVDVMGVTSEWNLKHRNNPNTPLPVDDRQEGQVVDAGFI